jgi:membrane protease YdiL (CAAX protease family)
MNNQGEAEVHSQHWPITGRVALFWLGYALLSAGVAPFGAIVPHAWRLLLSASAVSLGAILLTLLLLKTDKVSAEEIGIGPERRSGYRFALGFVAGSLLVALHVLIVSTASVVHLARAPETTWPAVLITLLGYLAASSSEELGFRGYPLQRLRSAYGLWIAQGIVAVAFAMLHILYGQPWLQALVGTGAGSLLFGMAAVATRGLAAPIGLHAAWNFGEWLAGGKGVPGWWRIVAREGSSPSIIPAISYFTVMGLGFLAFYLWYRRDQRRLA